MKSKIQNILNYRWFLLLKYIRSRVFSIPLFGTSYKTLLIVKLDSIGDFVIFRNFIEQISQSDTYKGYKITLCGNIWWKDIAEKYDAPFISNFVWVDYSKLNDSRYMFSICKTLYKKRFHTVIHPTYSRCVFSDDIVLHCGAKIKIGQLGDNINLGDKLKSENDKLYTKLIDINSPFAFEFHRYKLFFNKLLNVDSAIVKPVIPHVNLPKDTIILCPGAKHTFRQWSPKNFAQLAYLLEKNFFPEHQFIICGSASETHLAKDIMEGSSLNFADTTGKISLLELIDVMASSKLVITNDSGPFHVAVALNKKTLCISNGNHFGRFNPYPIDMKTNSLTLYPAVVEDMVKKPEHVRDFQLKGSTIDINLLTVEEVFEKLKLFLATHE